MNLKIAQVIGLNTDQKAAQVTSSAQNGDNFFAVLELTCDDAFTKGRQALSDLSDFYFEAEGTPAQKITATFEEANKKFAETEYDFLVASISGKVLYLIGQGEVEVLLKRGDKISKLLSLAQPKQLVSGFLQEGDKILFSTQSLNAFLGEDLDKSLGLSTDEFETEVSDRIGVSDLENQGLAALLVDIQIESEGIPSLEEDVQEKRTESENVQSEYSQIKETSPKPILILEKAVHLFSKIFKIFPKSGRGRLILAVILIIIVSGGITFKYISTKNAEKLSKINSLITQSRDDFNSAKGLKELNSLEAKAKLDSAKDKVNQALGIDSKSKEALELKAQIESEGPSILQQSEASEFPEFLDLNLIKEGMRSTKMTLSSNKLLLLDEGAKSLVVVDIAKKSNSVLAGEEQLGDAKFASINGNFAFVFSGDKGILRVDSSNKKVITVAKTDDEWGSIIDIAGFAGNLYALDTAGSKIWKYVPTGDGYSAKREYLAEGVKADFANSVRMQIESSIYVLKSGGEMLRFTKGNKDNFSYEGLDKGVKDPKSFFVSSDTENLYLLDSGNSRLLILTKTGDYKGQITGGKFASATDLVVDEKGKKVYLLEGSKIYQVDLK